MVGGNKGFVGRLRGENNKVLANHCIIHQAALCGKLKNQFKELMLTLMKLVNFLRAKSSLRHRQLRAFLEETGADYDELLLHNDVRWLSKGQVLRRLWDIREHIIAFLKEIGGDKAREYQSLMQDTAVMAQVAFLLDFYEHMNVLNRSIQGRDRTVCSLYELVSAFLMKLSIWSLDLGSTRAIHFPTLRAHVTASNLSDFSFAEFIDFIQQVQGDFESRFSDFKQHEHLLSFVRNPFSAKPDGSWISEALRFVDCDEATLQLALVDLQCNLTLKEKHASTDVCKFWIALANEPAVRPLFDIAVRLLSIFGSTYLCESTFSTMNNIKNKHRSKLTNEHLEACLRVAVSTRVPDFKLLARRHCD